MITHEDDNGIQQKAQASTPGKEHLWVVVLCSILGVALPMVGGFWAEWPLVNILPTEESNMTWLVGGVVLVVVPVTTGSFLLSFAFRTWWAAVFAGIAWYIGNILTTVVHQLVIGAWSGWPTFWDGEGILALAIVPTLIGMALGAACAYPLVKWRASRK
jgi:hypothetical protein